MFTPNATTPTDTPFNLNNSEPPYSEDSHIDVLRLILSLLVAMAVMLLSGLAGYYLWQNRRLRKEPAHQQSIQRVVEQNRGMHETEEASRRAEAERIAGERAEERTRREKDLEAQHGLRQRLCLDLRLVMTNDGGRLESVS